MATVRIAEIVTGWLAVALGVAIALTVWLSGMIAPESVFVDLFAFAFILALIAGGVTLDAIAPTTAARAVALTILTIGTLLLLGVTAISFLSVLFVPSLLAIVATVLAYTGLSRPISRPAHGA